MRARFWIVVLGTLIALGIWYARPVMAHFVEGLGGWGAVWEAVATVCPPRTPQVEETPTPAPEEDEEPGELLEALPALAREAVAWALRDAAARLSEGGALEEGAALSAEVVAVQPEVWRDSSLGCASPGGFYLQVLTPGYRIVVRVGDALFEYHSAEGQPSARLCGAP